MDANGIEGEYSAIALGVDGLGVISYYAGSGGAQDLKVAHCGNVACTTSSFVTADSAGNVGWSTSITIGSDGLPFVSYRESTTGASGACTARTSSASIASGGAERHRLRAVVPSPST